jgi:hypothetical protein
MSSRVKIVKPLSSASRIIGCDTRAGNNRGKNHTKDHKIEIYWTFKSGALYLNRASLELSGIRHGLIHDAITERQKGRTEQRIH